MRKLVVTCQCGQRMQVPRSAVGKTGLCPACGQIITISNDNAQAAPIGGNRPLHNARQTWWQGRATPTEEAKRKFGEAADLFYAGKYGEAMAIFDTLAKQYPGNPDIENGRMQCLKALRQPPLAIESRRSDISPDARLDEETVRRVVLEKLLLGSEATQLQAAELAARILGMFGERSNGQNEVASENGEAGNHREQESVPENGSLNEEHEPAEPEQ